MDRDKPIGIQKPINPWKQGMAGVTQNEAISYQHKLEAWSNHLEKENERLKLLGNKSLRNEIKNIEELEQLKIYVDFMENKFLDEGRDIRDEYETYQANLKAEMAYAEYNMEKDDE